MKYKAKYTPSKLLCLSSYAWFDAGECIKKIEGVEGGCVARFADEEMKEENAEVDLSDVDVGVTQDTWDDKEALDVKKHALEQFIRLIGKGHAKLYKIIL
jgi:hypothetical protein